MYDLILCSIPEMGLLAPSLPPLVAQSPIFFFVVGILNLGISENNGEERYLCDSELIEYLQQRAGVGTRHWGDGTTRTSSRGRLVVATWSKVPSQEFPWMR